MVNIPRGEHVLHEVLVNEAQNQPYFALPEHEPVRRWIAGVTLEQAGLDTIQYQLLRLRYELEGEWVRGEIDTFKFAYNWDSITGAMQVYESLKRNDARYS